MMRKIKEFTGKKELDTVIKALEKQGIDSKSKKDGAIYTLFVNVGYFIKARDIMLDMADEKKKLEKWGNGPRST
jgi:hypothetical protein